MARERAERESALPVDPPGAGVPAGPTRLHPLARAGGRVSSEDPTAGAELVCNATLSWLERRAGTLPPEAWRYGAFTLDHGGTVAEAAAWSSDDARVWAARLRYPDDRVAGRVWRTEVTVTTSKGTTRTAVRLDVADREPRLALEVFSVPRLVRWLVRRQKLSIGDWPVSAELHRGDEVQALAARLTDPRRPLPVILLSLPDHGPPAWAAELDPARFALRLAGIAEIVLVSAGTARALTQTLGEAWRCFGGAVRLFRAPFQPESDAPHRHPLFVPDQIRSFRTATGTPFAVHLALLAGRESLASHHPDLDVPTFARVQTRMRELHFARAQAAARPPDELLKLAQEELAGAKRRLVELEAEFDARRRELEELLALAEGERDEALKEAQAARVRIACLEAQLRGQGRDPDQHVPLLTSYRELADWAAAHLAGRVVLLPRAVRAARDGLFEDVGLVGRALLYLAGPYRTMRLKGNEASRRANETALAELGLENSSVGGDLERFPERFRVAWRGQKRLLDMHVKKGNARDPRRCLRIYYFWDEVEQLVVVGWLPSHMRTEAT